MDSLYTHFTAYLSDPDSARPNRLRPRGKKRKRNKLQPAKRLLIAILALAFSVLPVFGEESKTDVDELIDLLVSKKIISTTEAAELRARVTRRAAEHNAAPQADSRSELQITSQQPVSATTATPPGSSTASPPATLHTEYAKLKLSGFAQTRWTGAPNTDNSIEIRRARLILDGDLGHNITFRVQGEAAKTAQLLDAQLDFHLWRQLQVTLGQFKVPFSQESIIADNFVPFIERAAVVNGLVPGRDNGSNGRDIGAQVYGGLLPIHGLDRIEYAAAIFNGAGIDTTDNNHRKDASSRLLFRPLQHFSVAGDYYNGASGPQEIAKVRKGLEAAYTQGPLSLTGEYIWGNDGALRRRGWYAESVYRFPPRWEAVFRFDKYNPRQHTATITAVNNYVLGGNFYTNQYVKLQADYEYQDDLFARKSHNVYLLQAQFQFGPVKERK